jgi:hypothetical protein
MEPSFSYLALAHSLPARSGDTNAVLRQLVPLMFALRSCCADSSNKHEWPFDGDTDLRCPCSERSVCRKALEQLSDMSADQTELKNCRN